MTDYELDHTVFTVDPGQRETFAIDELFGFSFPGPLNNQVEGYKNPHPLTPKIDPDYIFSYDVLWDLLNAFQHKRNILIRGYHGTGKTSHIEQVCARLNMPCVRINLDSNLSRSDVLGREHITVNGQGLQVTEFKEGFLPLIMRLGGNLILDEFDSSDSRFSMVFQSVLESAGKLTLLEKNEVITPSQHFRITATANTNGLGDETGLYSSANRMNQATVDRFPIKTRLDYLSSEQEEGILLRKVPGLSQTFGEQAAANMVQFVNEVRAAFKKGDLSITISPRGSLDWAINATECYGDLSIAANKTFLGVLPDDEIDAFCELYQRCIGADIPRQINAETTFNRDMPG